jgi:hypothetical protein
MPDLMAAAEAVCAAHGWLVLNDLTETRSGWATPVLQVDHNGCRRCFGWASRSGRSTRYRR